MKRTAETTDPKRKFTRSDRSFQGPKNIDSIPSPKNKKVSSESRAGLNFFGRSPLEDLSGDYSLGILDQDAGKRTPYKLSLTEPGYAGNTNLDRKIELVVSDNTTLNTIFDDEQFKDLFKRSNCPVLAVPPGKSLGTIKKVGYITDVRFCDQAVTIPLARLCKVLRAELVLIHVNASGMPDIENEFAEDIFRSTILPRLSYPNAILLNLFGKDIVSEIENVKDVISPDILALCGRKYGFYDKLFNFDEAVKPSYANVPLLVFPGS